MYARVVVRGCCSGFQINLKFRITNPIGWGLSSDCCYICRVVFLFFFGYMFDFSSYFDQIWQRFQMCTWSRRWIFFCRRLSVNQACKETRQVHNGLHDQEVVRLFWTLTSRTRRIQADPLTMNTLKFLLYKIRSRRQIEEGQKIFKSVVRRHPANNDQVAQANNCSSHDLTHLHLMNSVSTAKHRLKLNWGKLFLAKTLDERCLIYAIQGRSLSKRGRALQASAKAGPH